MRSSSDLDSMEGLWGGGGCCQPLLQDRRLYLCDSRNIPLNLAKGVINDIGYSGLFVFCSNICDFRHRVGVGWFVV